MFDIADESSAAAGDRERLLDRAMGPGWRSKPSQRLRTGNLAAPGLSLVATRSGRLIGSVRLWPVRIGLHMPALLLGPLAVAPEDQGLGIGGALMETALDRAAELGHEGIILVGNPGYYRKFGFSAGMAAAVRIPGQADQHRVMGLELIEGGLAGAEGRLLRPNPATPHRHPERRWISREDRSAGAILRAA